jgi:hypothetical protein
MSAPEPGTDAVGIAVVGMHLVTSASSALGAVTSFEPATMDFIDPTP